MDTKLTTENGITYITIKVPLQPTPQPSTSGKTLIAYTSGGFNKTEHKHPQEKSPLSVSLTITVPNR